MNELQEAIETGDLQAIEEYKEILDIFTLDIFTEFVKLALKKEQLEAAWTLIKNKDLDKKPDSKVVKLYKKAYIERISKTIFNFEYDLNPDLNREILEYSDYI